ncbi:MAG: hypothetical protein BAJALOKI3v1_170059 [Promethearchaeota archaeon]|nr:MAG: hypothetical protein BAJALOKI3v1_170059 [Candidatus Lokiarchaeota archaeon]
MRRQNELMPQIFILFNSMVFLFRLIIFRALYNKIAKGRGKSSLTKKFIYLKQGLEIFCFQEIDGEGFFSILFIAYKSNL